MSGKPKVVSLFCGCGGSTQGYKQIGFAPLLGVDTNENSLESYSLNHKSKTLCKDIRQIKGLDILDLIGLEEGELDLLDSSPPCQGFSITGQRKLLDIRNELVFYVLELIKEIKPKTFVIENVDGMLKGKMRGFFNHLLSLLDKMDYKIKWKSLNGIYYGLPQKRQRLFIVGVRNDIEDEFEFPQRVESFTYFNDVVKGVEYQNRGQFDKSWKTTQGNFAYTITKTPTMRFMSSSQEREPTIKELKQLSSFPEHYQLVGSYSEQWGQIGNAVPPLLTEKIGFQLIKMIL